MKHYRSIFLCICLLALLGMPGCTNPAKDKPAAEVSAPVETEHVAEAAGTRYSISEESSIGFVGSKITGKHEGGFKQFSGEIMLIDNDPVSSSITLSIDTTSLWADSDKLAGHLMSPDFFDVETFGAATFETTGVTGISGEAGVYTVTGNLNLHGVTKSISFPANINVGDQEITANAEFSIKRFEFGVVYPGHADDLIRDEVVIMFNLKAVPAEG
jgi:polyisoprenoid-binding protein YceI